METIGMIAAMPQESNALLRWIEKRENFMLGPFRCYRFRVLDRDCLVVQSGIGLKRAMDATRALVLAANPQYLVSFGIAGAVMDDLQIGDVVVARHTCMLEEGIPGQFLNLAPLSEAAWEATAQALQPRRARLVSGTALTTRGSQVVLPGPHEYAHPVLEMETTGIAQVAAEWGIPLIALRAISDNPQAPIPLDLEMVYDDECNLQISQIIKTVLRHPGILIRSTQVGGNIRTAADNAAIALVAALSQPLPVVAL
jgi:adenosylhomocysteine nucleosidase